jgi:anaerobic selenocysteine-containing dehydrogenase
MLGAPKLPYFDIERAEVTFSFGANFTETWLSPVAYAYGYGQMRRGHPGQRGYLVQFEPRMSQTAANADEWFPILPGSEGVLAQALVKQIALAQSPGYNEAAVDSTVQAAADASGVPVFEIRRLANMFSTAQRKVAIPGGVPLGHTNGLEAAKAILSLNIAVNNLGADGGLFFLPDAPVYADVNGRPSSAAEMQALVERLNSGQIKAVFVHGANPAYDLPAAWGFTPALGKAELVVSFSSHPDETALQADYVLPGPTALESFGYQKVVTGADRMTLSGFQPVVTPLHDTRAMADVLLSAAAGAGKSLPFADEAAFLQQAVQVLADQGGVYADANPDVFWMLWLQHGGWWKAAPGRVAPAAFMAAGASQAVPASVFDGDGEFYLLPFPHPNLGDGSQANIPALQETPDPTTTVMWNTWVEINPETAKKLGLHDDDVVLIESPAGKIEVSVYLYPAIRPDTIAVPLGQGHTAYGRYAAGRGQTPLALLGGAQNAAGGLAFMGVKVKLTPTGKTRPLARYESQTGVYSSRH